MPGNSYCIKASKLLLSVFIFYQVFIKEAFGNYPIILYGTVILATVLIAIDVMSQRGKLPIFGFSAMLMVYGTYSFLSGLFVSKDTSWFYSIMVTYFAFAIVCFDCCYIIKRTESSEWILNVFLISAIACSIKTIFFGADYRTEVIVRTMSIDNNPNTLGLSMIVGIFSLVSRKKYVVNKFWLTMGTAMVFLYVILLSASRKCLFAALALVGIWIISVLRTDRHFSARKISMIIAVIAAISIGMYYFVTRYATTSSFARMLLLNSAANSRATLYQDAIEYWKTSPIIGIGFCQYQIWSPYRLYSHSTYAEILCCTGIIGVIIFFVPLARYTITIIKQALRRDDDNHYDLMMSLAMIIIELALGAGQIFIYDVTHLLVLTYLCMGTEYIMKENKEYLRNLEVSGKTTGQGRFFKRIKAENRT